MHAFFILGSYGQGAAMQPEERKKVAEIIVEQVKHRVPVVVHIGAVDPYSAIDLGKHAKAIGADAIGHVGPYWAASMKRRHRWRGPARRADIDPDVLYKDLTPAWMESEPDDERQNFRAQVSQIAFHSADTPHL